MKRSFLTRVLFAALALSLVTVTIMESCSSRRPNSTVRKLNKMQP